MHATTVADVMTRDVVSVEPTTPFKDVVKLLGERGISAVAVLGAGSRLVGVVSEADLLVKVEKRDARRRPGILARPARQRARKASGTTALDVMTPKVTTVDPDAPLSQAARALLTNRLRRLFVVDGDGTLVGVLARRDVLRVFTSTDAELAELVQRDVARFALWVTPAEVTVRVNEGEVTLEGELDVRSEVERAGDLTARIPGVVAVHNNIRFATDDLAAPGLRT